MELYKHQAELLARAPDRYLFCWDCGTGKTRTSIELAEQKTYDLLVIMPKALKANWRREVEKWGNGNTGYSYYTKEQFKKAQMEGTIRRHDGIIIDEAHFFASSPNKPSQMTKSLLKYIKEHDIRYIYALTATPYLVSAWNVYTLGLIFGHQWHYQKFKYAFFNEVNMGGRLVPVPKANTEKELATYVHQLGVPVSMDETGVDVPEVTFQDEYFELNAKQKKKIEESYDADPLTRFTREHQICGGTIKGDEFTDSEVFGIDKRERVVDLAKEHDKLIVVCRYMLEIESLQDVLSKAGIEVDVITGDTKDRDGVLQNARKKNKGVLLVSAGCSEGWEYPEVRVMVFYSYDFSLKNYIQMLGRIQRRNKLAKRTYLSLVTKGTVDEDIFKSLLKKESFHMEIYSKKNESKLTK